MGPAPDTTLAAWYQRLVERPSVAATFAEHAAAAGRMPAILDAFRSGAKVREYRDYRLEWMIRSGGMEVVLAGLRAGTIRFSWPHA
jgi:RNA polymerase-associated protein